MDHPRNSPEPVTAFETTLWILVSLTLLILPFVIMRPALDAFRTAKDVFFQTMALLIFAVGTAGLLLSDRIARRFRTNRKGLLLALASILWTAVTSITSLQPSVSHFKTLTVFCLAAFFVAAIWVSWRRGVWALSLVIIPAAVNGLIALLQSAGFQAFVLSKNAKIPRLRATGFIGNPNELGGYLVLPLVAAMAAAIAWPRWRWLFGSATLLLLGGIIASQSITPVIATGTGIAAMMFVPRGRILRRAGIIVLLLLIIGGLFHPGSRARMNQLATAAQAGGMSELTSFRLPAFAVALKMFSERPLLGVGPGGFSARFMPYKLRLDAEHPTWIRFWNESFGEVHNDHLQLLAETGIFGYLLFLGALFVIARISFTSGNELAERENFVRAFAFPAVAAFFVLALAHFPMQLTSTITPAIYLSALCFAWTDLDEVA